MQLLKLFYHKYHKNSFSLKEGPKLIMKFIIYTITVHNFILKKA